MRLFHLVREEDTSGVSGTGIVAQGVEFDSGWVSMTWVDTNWVVVSAYANIRSVEGIHGHGGKTKVVWLDDELAEQAAKKLADKAEG